MKRALVIPVLLVMAFAPIAPATPTFSSPAPATETCAMACCQEQAPATAAKEDCAPSCRCPVSCVAPAHTTALMPIVSGICPPQACPASAGRISDESAPERTARPPVPPPRA